MRVWDIDPAVLCKSHLLGEHREIHAVWNVITLDKKGYSQHPETKRWIGKLKALYLRHQKVAAEILRRGWQHKSELDIKLATGSDIQDQLIDSKERQIEILKEKNCYCPTDESK